MSTGNFWTMDDFDLIVFRDDYDGTIEEARQEFADYEALTKEEVDALDDDQILEFVNENSRLNAEDDYREIQRLCEEKTRSLQFYQVEAKSGYYAGLQLYAEERGDWYSEYHGCVVTSMMAKERRVLNDWMNQIGRDYGGYRASVAYRFSNGETGYNLEPCNKQEAG